LQSCFGVRYIQFIIMTMTKKRKHAISDEMNTDKEDELNFKANPLTLKKSLSFATL